jgi:hypothetical protein
MDTLYFPQAIPELCDQYVAALMKLLDGVNTVKRTGFFLRWVVGTLNR